MITLGKIKVLVLFIFITTSVSPVTGNDSLEFKVKEGDCMTYLITHDTFNNNETIGYRAVVSAGNSEMTSNGHSSGHSLTFLQSNSFPAPDYDFPTPGEWFIPTTDDSEYWIELADSVPGWFFNPDTKIYTKKMTGTASETALDGTTTPEKKTIETTDYDITTGWIEHAYIMHTWSRNGSYIGEIEYQRQDSKQGCKLVSSGYLFTVVPLSLVIAMIMYKKRYV